MNKILKFFAKLFGIIIVPKWNECTKSSNWAGANAQQRMMNILSPHMPDETFKARLSWMKSRGVNTAHVILVNKGDGEFSGYSPYGSNFSWNLDKNYCKIMSDRIKKLYKEDLGIILWLISDDSNDWAKELIKNPGKFCKDIKDLGWFDYASTVVAGLELGEYYNGNQVASIISSIKANYKGKVGTHENSGKTAFAGLGDIVFYQINPTTNQTVVANEVKKALGTGKPVNFFESFRCENRQNCETAFKNGAFAVGNY